VWEIGSSEGGRGVTMVVSMAVGKLCLDLFLGIILCVCVCVCVRVRVLCHTPRRPD
jgi:hypothetical protein